MTSYPNIFTRLWTAFKPTPVRKTENPLRFGILGAAKITPVALILPANQIPDVLVVAVAARDKARAEAFAKKHGIPNVFDDYQSLIESDVVEAIYIPLPNGLHFEWAKRALEAGKHVLLEKPSVSNATQAAELIALSAKHPNLILLEAFHYRFHPAATRFYDLTRSATYGPLTHVSARLFIPPIFPSTDIRFDWSLAGGTTMDTGAYTLNSVRWLLGAEPVRVTSAAVTKFSKTHDQIDVETTAELEFPPAAGSDTPRTATVEHSLGSSWLSPSRFLGFLRAETETHTLIYWNFIAPYFWHSIRITDKATNVVSYEKVYGTTGWTTYTYQLEAFVKAVRTGEKAPGWITDEELVGNMTAIDLVYEKLGLLKRE
ncbi:NAD(P)-binding protein [Jimgerdemannia flammicorona]|uniref:D-xylose 1-dehydrogenase (NADP(+), D-xylono-1,5-lactone-forming) n=1 Tax=Jimgerdemannia flammicorona TaxID=994334 RepID=A0A433Q8M4_9FUNG|nr:NAD(P)-binding protein [Jimgerdemannia flammicorona]